MKDWKCCGRKVPQTEIVYFSQITILYLIIIMCIFNLTYNKKPRGFMQSCFPVSVYFKCLSEFLLYFYKCSTSMAFT